jgi:hypothetical protein
LRGAVFREHDRFHAENVSSDTCRAGQLRFGCGLIEIKPPNNFRNRFS